MPFRCPLALPLLLAGSILACDNSVTDTGGGEVSLIEVRSSSRTLAPGETVQLQVTLRDVAGRVIGDVPVLYSSSNSSVALVSSEGLVTALSVGQAVITIRAGSAMTTTTITVASQGPPDIASIEILPATLTLSPGQSVQLQVVARDSQGGNVPVTEVIWLATDATVATVSEAGRVTAVAVGQTTVRALVQGQQSTAAITVTGG